MGGAAEGCEQLLDLLRIGSQHPAAPAATPGWFRAVGEWYRRFDQVGEDEVEEILASARGRQAGRGDVDSDAWRSTVE